jgi:hypothetical protein
VNEEYYTLETTKDIIVYRVYGGGADKVGAYATFDDLSGLSRDEIRQKLALKEDWNSIEYISEIKIPAGEKINIGSVKSQIELDGTILNGGASQILMPYKDWSNWILNNNLLQ